MTTMVHVEVLSDRDYRPIEGEFVLRTMVRLHVSDLAESLPLRLCLAIDKSLSMRGEKIEQAKTSARKLIAALRPEDEFALLAFGSTVEMLCPLTAMSDERRAEALAAVDRLEAGGVTRLDLALDEAYRLLGDASNEAVAMLLLLSDGAPTNPLGYVLGDEARGDLKLRIGKAFRGKSQLTSAIGLGDAEACLAPYLEACAESGGGMFYHEDRGDHLAERFIDEFNRVKESAVTDTRFEITGLHGKIRRAACVFPDIRNLNEADEGGMFSVDVGALQRGEEYVYLLEIVTPEADVAKRVKLGDLTVHYKLGGESHQLNESCPIVEFTNDENLLQKPPNDQVEKYKGMFAAFLQTAKAAENIREGGDVKRTKVLLQSAAKTTKRLGLSRQTKLLDDIASKVDQGASVSANDVAAMTVSSRKTKVLSN